MGDGGAAVAWGAGAYTQPATRAHLLAESAESLSQFVTTKQSFIINPTCNDPFYTLSF